MIWLCRVRIFLDYKIAYSKDSECTELLAWFSPADAMHAIYTFDPIKIYAPKREVITEIGESQAMMEIVMNTYLNNLENVSSNDDIMHMDPEFWYQQHTLDSDVHHLNRHMSDIAQKDIRGDATRMETYIELGEVVCKHQSCS